MRHQNRGPHRSPRSAPPCRVGRHRHQFGPPTLASSAAGASSIRPATAARLAGGGAARRPRRYRSCRPAPPATARHRPCRSALGVPRPPLTGSPRGKSARRSGPEATARASRSPSRSRSPSTTSPALRTGRPDSPLLPAAAAPETEETAGTEPQVTGRGLVGELRSHLTQFGEQQLSTDESRAATPSDGARLVRPCLRRHSGERTRRDCLLAGGPEALAWKAAIHPCATMPRLRGGLC